MENEDFTKTISVQVKTDCYTKEVALIVPYYTDSNGCALPAGECLFLMLNDILFLFELSTLKIKKQNKLDSIGTMFEAYSYKQDFI